MIVDTRIWILYKYDVQKTSKYNHPYFIIVTQCTICIIMVTSVLTVGILPRGSVCVCVCVCVFVEIRPSQSFFPGLSSMVVLSIRSGGFLDVHKHKMTKILTPSQQGMDEQKKHEQSVFSHWSVWHSISNTNPQSNPNPLTLTLTLT